MRQNSAKAWLLASRPKTLTGAAVPVLIGAAQAVADSAWHPRWVPMLLCLLFAFVMQVDANFINDYFDFLKGTDDEHRLGPKRACAQGWVTLCAMRWALIATTALACGIGLPLVLYGGWEMVAVGVLCVLFCFLYTTHLSYMGMGDVLVLLFFGLVPVTMTYYLSLPQPSALSPQNSEILLSSVACGLVVDTLLVLNNYRDIDNDRRTGKRTLIVAIGAEWGLRLYLLLGIVACLIGTVHILSGHPWAALLPIVGYLPIHVATYVRMRHVGEVRGARCEVRGARCEVQEGEALNIILGLTARNIFIYGVLTVIGLLI